MQFTESGIVLFVQLNKINYDDFCKVGLSFRRSLEVIERFDTQGLLKTSSVPESNNLKYRQALCKLSGTYFICAHGG